jgi:hypothetical protein
MQNQQLASDIFGVSKDVCASTGQITGTVQALNLSARDSADRNAHAITNAVNTSAQITQNGVERTAALTQSGIERTSGGIQTNVSTGFGTVLANQERNAGETRLTNLQTNSDARFQWADQTRDIITLVNSSSFENRLALSTSFASILAEQAKNKEQLSLQMCENKYEDLKNQNMLTMQIADVKNQNALLSAESKYEALKNHNMLSSQLAECCCELKSTIHSVDDARIRDDLNRARIVNELRYSYGPGYGQGFGQGFPGCGNLGGAVAGGFGFQIGENLANSIIPGVGGLAAAASGPR